MSNLIPTLRYLWRTLAHKAFVFRAGLRLRVPLWQLLVHDWQKFLPWEAWAYGRHFFGDQSDPDGFARAWLHHQNSCPHHWEYWIPRTGHGAATGRNMDHLPLPMPERFVREMVADWLGAARGYQGSWPESLDRWTFYQRNKHRHRLAPETALLLDQVLTEAFNGGSQSARWRRALGLGAR